MTKDPFNLFTVEVAVEDLFYIGLAQVFLPYHAPVISIVRQFVKSRKQEAYSELSIYAKRPLESAEESGMSRIEEFGKAEGLINGAEIGHGRMMER